MLDGEGKDSATNVEMDTTININPDHLYGGWYETYDVETSGGQYYAEGVLETSRDEDGVVTLVGYDGCPELPNYIIQALEEKGIIIDL